ncbi:MAG: hypothetical protein ACOCX2_01620 [Armatimonadota bacterium]
MTRSLVLLLSVGVVCGAFADDQPIRTIAETGFEEGLAPFEVSWGNAEIATDAAHSGDASVRMEDGGAIVLPDIPYERGRQFRLRYWMRTEDIVRGERPWHRAGAQVQYTYPDGSGGHFDIGLTLGTTDWTRYERTIAFTTKRIPETFSIVLQNWRATGVVWFDDVELVELPPVELDPRIPPREEVEDQPPRVWPMPEVTDGPASVDNGITAMSFAENGLPAQISRVQGGAGVGAMVLSATVDGVELSTDALQSVLSGYDSLRGWMTRRRAVLGESEDAFPRVEVFTEQFAGSPIVTVFARLWLANGAQVEDMEIALELPEAFDRALFFSGNAPVRCAAPALSMTLDSDVTKPLMALHDTAEESGVAIYHPLPPELRRWYVNDYVPTVLPATATVSDGALRWSFEPAVADEGDAHHHTIDLVTMIAPYVGTAAEGLGTFVVGDADLMADELPFGEDMPGGYWHWPPPYRMRGLHVTRYHPWEAFASADAGRETFTWGHEGGFAWGWVSIPQKQMRFSPTSSSPLWRDACMRTLGFFVSRADESGSPPHISMYRPWATGLDDIEDFYHRHFAQDIEWRVGEWRTMLNEADYLTEEHRQSIGEELQAMRAIFDPTQEPRVTWTHVLPDDGGWWYEYMNIPRPDMRDGPALVLNTHTTSTGNAGELMLISRDLGMDEDFAAWREVFERGVDGLLWALGQDRAWTDYDENHVEYALATGGPAGYHVHMVGSWLPRVIRISDECGGYRLDELLAYERRMTKAKIMQENQQSLQTALELLAELENGQEAEQ